MPARDLHQFRSSIKKSAHTGDRSTRYGECVDILSSFPAPSNGGVNFHDSEKHHYRDGSYQFYQTQRPLRPASCRISSTIENLQKEERMFQVKICGVTSPKDACLAAVAGADCIGLNFVPGSPRCISAETAHTIRTSLPAGVNVVGVFAGASSDVIHHIVSSVGLDAVQLHGHLSKESSDQSFVDTPELCHQLKPIPVIRAIRLNPSSQSNDCLAAARQWLDAAMKLGHPPVMAIVDAPVSRETTSGELGGTGAMVDWTTVSKTKPLSVPMALAGGLTAENVATAIRTSGLRAVDTASGVESSPGQKDEEKLFRFVHAARLALQNA